MGSPLVVQLSEVAATDPDLTGAKAANLARAAHAGFPTLPGFAITTAGVAAGTADPHLAAEVRDAWSALSGGTAPVVVRSSSTIEDAAETSMAGRFTSVLDVVGWDQLLRAIDEVVASGDAVRGTDDEPRPLAVLVQRQVEAPLGGVLFGVDPVSGRRSRLVVEAVPSRPDLLVGGVATADHYVLSRRGRIVTSRRGGDAAPLPRRLRRALARLARDTERVFGGPQDVEWCTGPDGALHLLQSRPVTAVGAEAGRPGPLLGPGPLAETFPAPLRPLEADLWIPPLAEGIRRALRASGAVGRRALERSPVATTVGGWAAVDLDLIGAAAPGQSVRRSLNPAVAVRRLATAWRVGRLRTALPAMVDAVIASVDRDLTDVPSPGDVPSPELVALLDAAARELATAHTFEILCGMLLGDDPGGTATGQALTALRDGRAAGWADPRIVAGTPVVLALAAPSLDGPALPADVGSSTARRPGSSLSRREALRLRVRWLQELQVRLVAEAARRAAADALIDPDRVAELRLDELRSMVLGGPPPARLADEPRWRPGPPLPVSFRLDDGGQVRAAPARGRPSRAAAGLPAGGGRAVGTVRHADGTPVPPGSVLVVRHLEPALAPHLDGLAGLVAETGSALSHLAILAREAGVATVVAVDGALDRYRVGSEVLVDGTTGEVTVLRSMPSPGPPTTSGVGATP